MAGSRKVGMVLQERDRLLLREIEIMRVVNRDHARTAAGFGSVTRVNARLLALTRAGLLRRFFLGASGAKQSALYTLSAQGAQLTGAAHRGLQRRKDEVSIGGAFVAHQLAINDLYCTLKFRPIPASGVSFERWLTFDVPLPSGLLPDGYIELRTPSGVLAAFVEVDLGTERTAIWSEKVQKYLQFGRSGEYEQGFGQSRFRVLVLVNSLRRMHSIRDSVAKLTDIIFWFSTLSLAKEQGFFQNVWLRPTSNQPIPLIKELS